MAYGNRGLGLDWSDVTGAVKSIRQTFGIPAITTSNVIKAAAPALVVAPASQAIYINDPVARSEPGLMSFLTPTNIILAGALAYAMMSSPRPRRVRVRRRVRRRRR